MNEQPNIARYTEMVNDLFKRDTVQRMYMHATIGIVGELIELIEADTKADDANILEELGDAVFFTEALLQLHVMPNLGELWAKELEREPGVQALVEAGELMDCAKRFDVYGKALEQARVTHHLLRFVPALFAVIRSYGYNLGQCQAHNMVKLLTGPKARYPLGHYSDEQANLRSDKIDGGQIGATAT